MGMFHVCEDGFHIIAAPLAFLDAFVAFKKFPGFFPMPLQIVVALDAPVSFGAVAHAPHWAAFTVPSLVVGEGLLEACRCFSFALVCFFHPLPHRTYVKILFLIVIKMLFAEGFVF